MNENQDLTRLVKLINGDLVFGAASKSEDNENLIVIEKPFTVKNLGEGPCVLPYEVDLLMEPMKFIALQEFNIMWVKNLTDFPEVYNQYISATSGIDL